MSKDLEVKNRCINNYLNTANPFCREERQYALMMAHLLFKKNNDIFKMMDLKGDILSVFFEVTLMRDYWFVNKKEFNTLLCEYVGGERNPDEENHANHWKKKERMAIWMMNAKPDIGLLLREENVIKLHFVECKYKSKESYYNNSKSELKMTQTQLQDRILDFLCNTLQIRYCEDSTVNLSECEKKEHIHISKGEVILVQFVREEEKSNQKDAIKLIPINYLINEYRRISIS